MRYQVEALIVYTVPGRPRTAPVRDWWTLDYRHPARERHARHYLPPGYAQVGGPPKVTEGARGVFRFQRTVSPQLRIDLYYRLSPLLPGDPTPTKLRRYAP